MQNTIRIFTKDKAYNDMPKTLTDSLSVLGQIGQAFITLGSIEYEFGNQTNTGNVAHIKHSINQQTVQFTKSGALDNRLYTMFKASQNVIILAAGYRHKYILLGQQGKSRILILPDDQCEPKLDRLVYIAQALWPGEELQCSGYCNWYLNDHNRTISIMLTKDSDFWETEKQLEATEAITKQILGSTLDSNGMAIIPQSIISTLPKRATISL